MKPSLFVSKWSERAIGAFKYLIAGYMMLAGALTMFETINPVDGPLGFLYTNRISVVIIGFLIFCSGLALLYGKVRKSKRWTGLGLFYVYLCFLFAALLNFIIFQGDPTVWVGNIIAAGITGALWLRWKFKTHYFFPDHFIRDIEILEGQHEANRFNDYRGKHTNR